MGSRNPRKIGMGVPNILGFVARGCRKMGVPENGGADFFCDTGNVGGASQLVSSSAQENVRARARKASGRAGD